nr:uncharacterized protein LOC123763939 [Procambarus clarkii]XP_045607223.1 uncharacterized protein LOC123763939 [Procambarus clarkii]XP_045607224.1 uncharacterized protein LOC123763939 [Procambarus clarkii]
MEAWLRSLVVCTSLALMTGGAGGIQVVEEPGLQVVENGTVDHVVLDCPFVLEAEDNIGLVIKWFHLNNPIAVYQWISGRHAPQATGILEGRLDLQFEVSEDALQRHRALKILRPTTELAGLYTCSISSFADEKLYTQRLLVYSEPQDVKVWTEEQDDDHVTVLCQVDHVFPQPLLRLRQRSAGNDSVALSAVKEVNSWSRGSYNLTVEATVRDDDLDGPTVFECLVTIPDTEVQVLSDTEYHPRVRPVAGEVKTGGGGGNSAVSVMAGLALLLLWRV